MRLGKLVIGFNLVVKKLSFTFLLGGNSTLKGVKKSLGGVETY